MQNILIGKVIDNYEIIEMKGRGGMGVVYKARDLALDIDVALKIIDPFVAQDHSFLKHFKTEARALAKLNDPNIVIVHALRETDFGLFMVMEYIEGRTLREWIEQNGAMEYKKAIPIFRQILSAVSHAHSVGVIHRDLKPSNLIITDRGTIKVTDFGLAKIQRGPDSTVTRGMGGTLKYVSPEQAQNLGSVDHRADIYSLGMTFYEMLAGRTPFEESDSEYSILKSIVEEKFPEPSQYNSAMPRSLTRFIMKALEKDPDKRFQSTDEMIRALQQCEIEEETKAVQAGGSSGRVPGKSPAKQVFGWIRDYRKPLLFGLATLAVFVSLILLLRSLSSVTTMTISTIPDGAIVMLNDENIGLTPIESHRVEAGILALEILKSGYFDIRTSVKVEDDQHLELDYNLEPAAFVSVAVDPKAIVFIDNEERDHLEIQKLELKVGEHIVRISKPGFKQISEKITLVAGQNEKLIYQLEPMVSETKEVESGTGRPSSAKRRESRVPATGSLQISSDPPDALVWMGGHFAGKTPLFIPDLQAREYSILIKKDGFQNYTTVTTITSSERVHLVAPLLASKKVKIRIIAVEPSGRPVYGEVYLDDQPLNRSTPLEHEVSIGTHKIEVRKQGYVSQIRNIQVQAPMRVTFLLERS